MTAPALTAAKRPSLASIRRQIGERLKPIREALHKSRCGQHCPVVVMGYRFTGVRTYKAQGQMGYAWHICYRGEPLPETALPKNGAGFVVGNLDEIASQLHDRLRFLALEAQKEIA